MEPHRDKINVGTAADTRLWNNRTQRVKKSGRWDDTSHDKIHLLFVRANCLRLIWPSDNNVSVPRFLHRFPSSRFPFSLFLYLAYNFYPSELINREIGNSKSKDFERRNEKCLVASWHRYIIDSFTFHRIFATLFLNNDRARNFLPFYSIIYCTVSVYSLDRSQSAIQTAFLSLSLKTLSCFPHFVHVSLLSLFSYLSIILFPSFVQIFVRSPLYRVVITYIVFEEAEMAPLSEDRLSDGEKSFIIGKWSIWDKQRSG